ncbi:alpha/beta fold hydrolase [Pseudomonas gingeri]|uniref:Alpha/beta hydrolase n=1 Tax=Pseudomonas gingeri TaxID=117681 RepID=A0A7Y7YIB3_9PSED|nr:alpha/beta hydrolase [Pseudomonas gingeri]NWA03634.1 alpha/beta hydrolase [Pseudomonas gingeri]NWA14492.1 alpha/beta hydrolase [Pseudomonas gingeri]NWA54890.1 alpha/beta hydrolase [Pseudomonas gingeri]NWA94614.1 alpha/beta hydrolase [Pseudomonas gingeri]NWB01270.1 alpha/beta hydrolase [Pseudomonas gingeri]
MSEHPFNRRRFLLSAAAGAAAIGLADMAPALASTNQGAAPYQRRSSKALTRFALRQVSTELLDIGYYEAGPENGRPVILLHGYPYDIHSYVDVAPLLAAQGFRVIVPHLRGHGTTRFLDNATPRSGQQAALGQDVLDLMNALHIPEAVLAGYDWGGRAACVAAALRPSRVVGLVSVNSYLIQDIAKAANPLPAHVEWGIWYQHYFQTERGRAGLEANRRDIARILWRNNSPTWHFDDRTFDRAAEAFDNPDHVDVVIHSYRHRMGLAAGYPDYAEAEQKLALLPAISVPTITLDGVADGVIAATDGKASAPRFSGPRSHRQIPGVGHNLPQEAPKVFADAVAELVRGGKWRT